MPEYPLSKVTIIIETDEERTVIVVPKAQEITFGPAPLPAELSVDRYMPALPDRIIPQVLEFQPIKDDDGVQYFVKNGKPGTFASLTELKHEVLDIRHEYAAYSGREYHPESEGENRPLGMHWKVLYRRVGAPYWDVFAPDAGSYSVASRIVASMTQFEIEKATERKENPDA